MHILGHYLDLATGEELPVVSCKIYAEEDGALVVKLRDGNQTVVVDQEKIKVVVNQVDPNQALDFPVAIRFVANPVYVLRSRRLSPGAHPAPRMLPEVAAVGRHSIYPCEMVRVKPRAA